MARKDIFSILAENSTLAKDIRRIILLAKDYDFAVEGYRGYSLKELVEDNFSHWKGCGKCIDYEDFLETIEFSKMTNSAYSGSVDAALSVIEVIYNFFYLVCTNIDENYYRTTYRAQQIKELMDQVLSEYNHKIFYDQDNERVYIIEDKPEVTAVAEIVEVDLAIKLLRYNHRTLKGDINAKKSILLVMGSELEPKRDKIASKDLRDNIFFVLNNFNIRHNNISKDDKNYKDFVANMSDTELEEWYDELYQMMLIAFLEIDQIDRNEKIRDFKKSIGQ